MSEPEGKRDAKARAIAAARPRLRAFAGWDIGEAAESVHARLVAALDEEREAGRFFLWLPVAAIAGALVFFAAARDPSLWAAMGAAGLAGGIAYAARHRPAGFPVAMLIAAFAAGFLSAAFRVERVAAPVLERPVRGAVTGFVEHVEPRPRGVRLVIAVGALGDLPEARLPKRVRVTVPRLNGAAAGSEVSVEALWRPPPGPVRPGGYDFAREAFFLGIGAVGSEARAPLLLSGTSLSIVGELQARIDRLRNAITSRIVSTVDGDAGAIAAALVTGQRGEISREANDALRIAGLYHVISISGLHMALFGGTLFGAVRFGLTLVPGFGLRRPVKKYAAAAAFVGAAGYLALSGAEIATQRSFVMIAIVFFAVIFDRQGITMRNLAVAALAAVLVFPEAVLGPSLQMSFCAVMTIVAWYETASRRQPDEPREAERGGVVRFVRLYFGGIVATTIAATVATLPFAAFHFQRFAVHSLPSNLIALPIVGLLVMPWALAGFVLMPFGLDAFAWQVMGFGIGIMLRVSEWIAGWPLATLSATAFSSFAALLLAFGLIWAAIWTTRLRWLAVLPLAAGVALAGSAEPQDIYIEPGGRAAAVRAPDGRLRVIGTRFARFAAETWLTADGDPRALRDESVSEGVRCDGLGCTAPLRDGRMLALTWTYAGLREDCSRAAVVVTRLVAPPSCRMTAEVVDADDLARDGAISLRILPDGTFRLQTARGDSARIWHGAVPATQGPVFARPEVHTKEPAGGGFNPTDMDDAAAPPDDPQ